MDSIKVAISIKPSALFSSGQFFIRMPGELRPKVEFDLLKYAETNKAYCQWSSDDYVDGRWIHDPKRPYQTVECAKVVYDYDVTDDSFAENICNQIADIFISHGVSRNQIEIEVWFYSDLRHNLYWMKGNHPTVPAVDTIVITSILGHKIGVESPSVVEPQIKANIKKNIKSLSLNMTQVASNERLYVLYDVHLPQQAKNKKADFAEQCCKDIGIICIASGQDPNNILIDIISKKPVKRYSPVKANH